jgi:DNA-binding Lrp family transcriptional regulator
LNKDRLSEKEFEIINVLGDGFRPNQRQISHHVGLSLGMTNLLLRRLVTKGYLRIRQLNRKKVEYILTPHGLSEKFQKTYHYTLKTIESFGFIRSDIRRVLQANLGSQVRQIIVVGEGDLADLTALTLQEFINGDRTITRSLTLPPAASSDTLVIDASPRAEAPSDNTVGHVRLLEHLAQGFQGRSRSEPPKLVLR